jgi:integrating conjugative element protein (TIGR03761 family)
MKNTNNTKKPGVLRNSIELELSTKDAVALFYGRTRSTASNSIVGLNAFAQKVKYINNAAHNNDPYADYFLLEVEAALKEAKSTLIHWQDSLTGLSSESLLTINQGSSTRPVALETSFASVYANIALELLKRADNLLLTLYALKHTGLMNRVACNKETTNINKLMRKTFLSADGYKFFSVNRKDVEQQTARYRQAHIAMKFIKELPAEILDKTLRAEHAPNIMIDPNDIFRKKPVKKLVKEPVAEPVKKLAETPVKEPAKEPVKEPIKTPTKEPVKKPVETPVKEPKQTKETPTTVKKTKDDE